MGKRTMGKRIFREPAAEQAAKYRRIREMIAAEIPESKQEAKALRQGRRAGIQQGFERKITKDAKKDEA